MSGTTLFSASRLLSDWQQRGFLGSRGGRLLIRDSHSLVTLADDLMAGTTKRPPSPQRLSRSRPAGGSLRQRKAPRPASG